VSFFIVFPIGLFQEAIQPATNIDTSTTMTPDCDWSKDRLMGKSVSFKGIAKDGTAVSPSNHSHNKDKIDPMLWGRPGHLSDEEADIYVSGSWFVWVLRWIDRITNPVRA
jgi:hypothetical protein